MRNRNPQYYLVNGITLYRLMAAPVMAWLIYSGNILLFSLLLPVSFFTDLIDGPLARKYKVVSVFGSRLDSLADDLTILAGIEGVFVLKQDFVAQNKVIIAVMIILLVIQNLSALIRYRKVSSFHTYLAKAAAVFQGSFLILLFLLPEPLYPLFYAAAFLSIADLTEEIILVFVIPKWTTDVKGLYWVLKKMHAKKPLPN